MKKSDADNATGTIEFEQVIDQSEEEDLKEPAEVRYAISSYGADYPVDTLVKRFKEGDIEKPQFQRGFIWTYMQRSKFIESLLLGLPVPGIFLSKDPDTQRLIIIDGQQRLFTLRDFYEGVTQGKEFKLEGVRKDFQGVTYKTLADDDRRMLDNSIIHATIINQEAPKEDQSSIYLVFERLNTLGSPLSSQEIRTCVYEGSFSAMLKKLNENPNWRTIYGPESIRMKDQELILRFFALHFDLKNYKRPMKLFLSDFMGKFRRISKEDANNFSKIFSATVELASETLGPQGFRPERALNASVTDAILVATADKLSKKPIKNKLEYQNAMLRLLTEQAFLEKCNVGTTDQTNVTGRIQMAKNVIESIV